MADKFKSDRISLIENIDKFTEGQKQFDDPLYLN